MNERSIDIEDVKSVFHKVGFKSEECDRCVAWDSPTTSEPLTAEDKVIAELTPEEEGFFRCMGYVHDVKVVDLLRLEALHDTFWSTVRSVHDLPLCDLAIKEGKYIVRTPEAQ